MIYIILALIQGITEPLPISSSGHVYIISKLFNINNNNLSLEIITNFGSLIAVLIYYRLKIKRIIKGTINYIKNKEDKNTFNYFVMIVTGTIPVVIIGGLFKDVIEENLNGKIMGIAFIVTLDNAS